MHRLRNKTYPALTSVYDEINNYKKEKVTSFDGIRIITDKNVYAMVDSIVYVTPIEEYKERERQLKYQQDERNSIEELRVKARLEKQFDEPKKPKKRAVKRKTFKRQ